MILESGRLILRPLEAADAAGDYPAWLNDPDVCRYNSHGERLYTPDMALAYIARVTGSATEQVYAITLKENRRHIGNIALQQISTHSRSAELAILIGATDLAGRGYGSEAARTLVDHGFSRLELHRIYCGTHAENRAMRRLALALGMREEGCRRDAVYKNGKFADIIEYGLLEGEIR